MLIRAAAAPAADADMAAAAVVYFRDTRYHA